MLLKGKGLVLRKLARTEMFKFLKNNLGTDLILRNTIVVSIIGILFFNIFFGEKIPVNNGKGWDGNYYYELSHELSVQQFFDGKTIGDYYIHRIAPWLFINVIEKFVCFFFVQSDCLVTTYQIAEIVLFLNLVIAVFLIIRIAHILNFRSVQTTLSIVLLLCNASILKISGYYIFLTEYYALTLMLCSIYFYLKKSIIALSLCTLVLNFTWPVLFFNYIMIYKLMIKQNSIPLHYKPSFFGETIRIFSIFLMKYRLLISVFCGISFIILSIKASLIIRHNPIAVGFYDNIMRFDNIGYIFGLLVNVISYFSIVLFFIYFGISFLWRKNKLKSSWFYSLRIIFLLTGILCLNCITSIFSNADVPNPSSPIFFLIYRILRISSLPWDVLICTSMYFGIFIYILILKRNQVYIFLMNQSWINIMAVSLSAIFMLNGEARMNIVIFPIVIFCLIRLIGNDPFIRRNIIYISIVALLLSRFYLPFGAFLDGQNFTNFEFFPNQDYFMYFSPWLSWRGWLTSALVNGVVFVLIRKFLKSFVR
jgi:hypothetical protein